MQATKGQKYSANIFYSGVNSDIDSEMLDPKSGAYLSAHCMQVSNQFKNVLSIMRGDKTLTTRTLPTITVTTTTTTTSNENGDIYGALYNWWAASKNGGTGVGSIAPIGFHVPTNDEFLNLMRAVSPPYGYYAGGPLKEAGYSHWKSSNTGATNSTGFTALPSAYRDYTGNFQGLTEQCIFWNIDVGSESVVQVFGAVYYTTSYGIYGLEYPSGLSVRCVKNTTALSIGQTSTVIDADGNIYPTICMPDGKEWMAKNLKVEHFNNGDPIPIVEDNTEWAALTSEGMCYYDNTPTVSTVSITGTTTNPVTLTFIGGVWLNGYVIRFYRDTINNETYIYANNILIGQHADYPDSFIDIDTNDETGEMFITDNSTVPIVLNLTEMLAAQVAGELTYTTDYDKTLYEVNKPIQLNQPVFVQLEDLGVGAGLRYGSYAYAMCYSSATGEDTPWSPISPYIPVPESAVSLVSKGIDDYYAGLKTWGGETALTPGRYGIRMKLRVTNLSGFDFIKIKRLANNTGQPISYVPAAEFIILATDALGGLIDPKTYPYNIIEFVDNNSRDWAYLDESVESTYSTIKKARTIRYFDRRICLGGVEYESKLVEDKEIFLTEPDVSRIAFPVVKSLGPEGFSNINNQVYNKSHRLGERYGFGAKLYDKQGNTLFTVPMKMQRDEDDFTNFQFPNRRDKIPVGVKRIDEITVDGTIGSATIVCNAITGVIQFHNSITESCSDFVTEYFAAYYASGVVVTSSGDKIRFIARVAGVDFTGPTSFTNDGNGDLGGTVVITHANVPATRQTDIILFADVAGSAVITVGSVNRTLVSAGTDLAADIANFILLDGPDFLLYEEITLSYASTGNGALVLTGPTDGSSFITSATGTLIQQTIPVVTTTSPVEALVRIDRIRLSANIGAADITVNGITRTATFHTNNGVTAIEFVAAYAADYWPNIILTYEYDVLTDYAYLIFTGVSTEIFTGETTVVTHTISDLAGTVYPTQPNVAPVPQVDIVLLHDITGVEELTCEGVQMTINNGEGNLTSVLQTLIADPIYIAAYAAVGVTFQYVTTGEGGIAFTGPSSGAAITTTTAGDLLDTLSTWQAGVPGTAQIDTITLTGTVGSAYVRCNGMTKGLTFETSLTDTATKFETDYKAMYAAINIDVVASGVTLIFTALSAGIPFYDSTSILNATDNLTGEVTYYQAAQTAVAQVDTVTLIGSSGVVTITCEGVTNSATFNINLEITAHNFYDNFRTAYAAVGVTVGFNSSGQITFTGPADGAAITTTATGTLTDNIYTVYQGAAGEAQIDTVTITGSSGSIEISCDGLVRGVTFLTTPTITAALFVTYYAAEYLALRNIEVTSSGADIIFTSLTLGDGFTTTVTQVNNTMDATVVTVSESDAGNGEGIASPVLLNDSTIDSWAGQDLGGVYDPVTALRTARKDIDCPTYNIISAEDPDSPGTTYPYKSITPTGRGMAPNNNKYEGILNSPIMTTVDEVSNVGVGQYGRSISTIGLRIGGIDTIKLPPYVGSFSIVRTPPAGRVVCQGIGMYSLQPKAFPGGTLTKNLDKLWFFSPEIDAIVGDKSNIYDDIKNNPTNYQLQLVAPCGFISDFYSSVFVDGYLGDQDMVSSPICGAGVNARAMYPPDSEETDAITFGKWRNTTQGDGLQTDVDLTFDITAAEDVPHGMCRIPYLELSLNSNIYANAEVLDEVSTTPQSKDFHEPWYIINIIQNKEVPNNNINSYNDIGHHIHLNSVVGISSGQIGLTFALVNERREDIYSLGDGAASYRYIWVDGKPWLGSNNVSDTAAYLQTLRTAGKFTPVNGLECYGMYTVNSANSITFDKVLPTTLVPVIPDSGAVIEVRYNSNSPIEVFLGDIYVADSSFLAIDTKRSSNTPAITDNYFLNAPMPQYLFDFNANYYQALNPLAETHDAIWRIQGISGQAVSWIRQWLIYFTCESTVNLPMMYKNFFPNRFYTMRPNIWPEKLDDETVDEYLKRMNIYTAYDNDYPNEYLNWSYGGFSTPSSLSFDYSKSIPLKSFAEPQSGVNERLSIKKRFHWSTQSIPGFASTKVFIPTNIYDLKNDKASQISILYDQYSDKGGNLYVITDRGIGLLITDKNMITTAEGNNLSILVADSSLVKGEIWLNNSVGCPREFWRGKAEGIIKLPNNVVASILVFPSYNDIILFNNNSFIQLINNNRKKLLEYIETIDAAANFSSRLFSVIDESENKLWVTMDTETHAFNFDINNWDGFLYQTSYEKSFFAPWMVNSNKRNKIIHSHKDTTIDLFMSQESPYRVEVLGALPYVVFAVTPTLGQTYEFTDMFISATFKPYNVSLSTSPDFSDIVVVPDSKIVTYSDGYYYIQGFSRTVNGDVLIGKTLYVKISFADTLRRYDLKLVKTGFKNVTGG
jgi:uncharacterized protein (TIGR02145 family)